MSERLTEFYGNCWTVQSFSENFGFENSEKGLSKEIRGRRYLFRQIRTSHELHRVVEIQKVAWGWKDTDLAPTHILALMEDTGGGVFGAFDENELMVGFAAGFGGGKDSLTGKPTIISSMLAMDGTTYRSSGIGKELKLIQAFNGYQQGYEVMKWFYDPERGENASLNLRKLGARVEEFHIDKYGQMLSELYGLQVPTDRFRAVWRFTQTDVINRILGFNKPPNLEDIKDIPVATENFMPDLQRVLVEISPDIDLETEENKIKKRYKLRKILSYYFLEKYYLATEFITAFVSANQQPNKNSRVSYYLLERGL
jgi:predicted GNAT superfamily acetyltransferase